MTSLANVPTEQDILSSFNVKTYCGGLNVIGPHKLIGSGGIRMCGLVGVGVALLKEVCHTWGEL